MATTAERTAMNAEPLRPAALAFDAIAPIFDQRFGAWGSVAAQRRAVRHALLKQFRPGAHVLEIGGGTGEDAAFLAAEGRRVLLTDASPLMVKAARAKLARWECTAEVAAGEDLEQLAERHLLRGGELLDGAFSNFAPLNCVADLEPVARALARLLKPGAAAMLVLFGTCCPAEMVTEALRGRPGQMFRRFQRGEVSARLARRAFPVFYHRRAEVERAFAPYFTLEKRTGIGIAVPPSAAEPWISGQPRLLRCMERVDRAICAPLAMWGDHVLYQLRRCEK